MRAVSEDTDMLQFCYEPDASKAAAALAGRLTKELESNDDVAWLVSGGSNVALSVEVMKQLPDQHLSKLTCLLSDERYGVPGHADSNWQQLTEAGFMERGATFLAALMPDMTMQDTVQHYAQVVESVFEKADVVIAQFGIGGDGHIAGILPRSAALTDDEQQLVAGFDGGAFQRITMTPPALRRVSAAYAYVYGETKLAALRRLQSETLPLSEQPSQILKELPEAYVYTDQQLPGVSPQTPKGLAV
jgi:6-phosphogluconolactonase/glucosamine-6-phosphate isomerase/deaminase